jgi:hypothetical protein
MGLVGLEYMKGYDKTDERAGYLISYSLLSTTLYTPQSEKKRWIVSHSLYRGVNNAEIQDVKVG